MQFRPRHQIPGPLDNLAPLGTVTGMPAILLRLEGAIVCTLSLLAYRHLGGTWLAGAALFLVPDLSMVFYLAGPRVGATAYNLVHSYCGPALLASAAMLHLIPGEPSLLLQLALLWAAHIGLDRMLGFGLKYPSAFSDTHLASLRRDQ